MNEGPDVHELAVVLSLRVLAPDFVGGPPLRRVKG